MSARTKLTLLNDVHSRLNATVAEVIRPTDLEELIAAVNNAIQRGVPMIASGSRHAMGGQEFCNRGIVVDARGLNRILSFDASRGVIEVEAGIEWPELVAFLQHSPWSIVQKQTGADRLTLGGAVSANIHGRGLNLRPYVQDLEALTLANARGELIRCSREENAELFRHAVGGYGLFGCVY
jgi:FAD/FMN-containing dehydrogenase